MSSLSAIAIANQAQQRAADPRASSWVSASAGSGKTTVLTKRVLALLLSGAPPERILCLTFTKAAAAQMSIRVAEKLAAWVTADEKKLEREVEILLARPARAADLDNARRLYAQVLDAPGGLRIETLHAFCQSLLSRFPLEAGVSPHFELIEERAAQEALHDAREHVIAAAASGRDAQLQTALAVITERVHETNFGDLLATVAGERALIEKSIASHDNLTGATAAIYRTFDAEPGETRDSVIAAACAAGACDEVGLMRAAKALAKGSKTDTERAAKIASWLKGDRVSGFAIYKSAFLTQAGTIVKKLTTKAIEQADPSVPVILAHEADRVFAVDQRLKAVDAAVTSAALLCLAGRILDAYKAYKTQRALLDYDDLIAVADRLLQKPGVAAWVLYKLDGGIDHVLIDEAQDTNPAQWSIVKALTAEFFAGLGRREDAAPDINRTVFAVGDRKQSIFGFQGADPEGFLRMREFFARQVVTGEKSWQPVELDVSFRSTTAVLKIVDDVFRQPTARDGVVLPDEQLLHQISRIGHAGLVALWPPMQALDSDEPPPWKPPVERTKAESAQNRLARLLASYIHNMIGGGDVLPSKGRPVRAGDIMVLVRRRTAFVDELIRNLKSHDVPVAGVDRMRLTEQLAVMDLMALGQFLILPEDDLTLACVLKSPLVGMTEDELFELAHPRGTRTLWSALEQQAGSATPGARAHAFLSELLAKADYWTPYHLFAYVLVAHDGRRKLLARLGPEADDPIDEFLNLTLAYQAKHPPSLQAFLEWLVRGDIEIKRDLEHGGNAVRIMTVHGAKGLQAPIVFMPDTMQIPRVQDSLYFAGDDEHPVMLWAAPNTERPDIIKGLRDDAQAAQLREYRRLLYVAMTRAEDRLYVCGWETKHKAPDTCWYRLIESAMAEHGQQIDDPHLVKDGTLPSTQIWQYALPQETAAVPDGHLTAESEVAALPDWASRPPPDEPDPPEPLTPSRPSREEPAVASPLDGDQGKRYQRGLLIHRLLQTLPDLPVARQRTAAETLVRRPAWDLTEAQQTEIVAEVLAVLSHPDFAAVFAPGSRAEVPITGMVEGQRLSGQIDRLAVTATDVWIIDYKTNRPPPRDAANVDPAYLFQMAAYRKVLATVYPDKAIRCVLLWTYGDDTRGPFLMELAADAMDAAFAAQTVKVES